jgi:hypothetical protein
MGQVVWCQPQPGQEVKRLAGSADLITLLENHWPATRTDPPADMTPHQFAQAMEAAEVGVVDLLHSKM